MERVKMNVNGIDREVEVEPWMSLNFVLREKLSLTGTKKGCDTGGCGACTVLLGGEAVYSCMTYAMKADGGRVTTIEGLGSDGNLDLIQVAYAEHYALQCGYCTPGFIMSTKALFDAKPDPIEEEIREALVGNLCRCTGYTKILEATLSMKQKKRKGRA